MPHARHQALRRSGHVWQSGGDASVVQVVRWSGDGAQADWTSSNASATPPACAPGRRLAPPRVARRALTTLLVVVGCLLGSEVALPASSVAPTTTAQADTGDAAAYDRSVDAVDCALLGRAFVPQLGCARGQCVDGAVPWRRTAGAEACALAGQPRGYGYAATVDVRTCRALHRRWIAAVNYCASQPDRSVSLLRGAPQCTPPASVYVLLTETEGGYDVCLTATRAGAMSRRASARGSTLADELGQRQGRARTTRGGVLMVGDSVTWRGSDELSRLRPALTIDGEPARRPTELAARLAVFRARHGQPAGLVVELGTNPAPTFDRRDLTAVVRTLPPGTPVMFVLPYVEVTSDPAVVSPWSQRFAGWMRSLAAQRPHSCVADWPAYVLAHPGLLQDGTHTRNDSEIDWARWISEQWEGCSATAPSPVE